MTREFSLVPALLVGGVLSQALSRFILPHGFYEQVLVDDGHLLNTMKPPRDLREWQNYPVSAIANFHPVLLGGLESARLREALERHPYSRFIYQPPGASPGLLLRAEMTEALQEKTAAPVHALPSCLREEPIAQVQNKLVESPHGIVAVLDAKDGAVVGLLTLHDILRTQQSMVVRGNEG